MAILGSGPHACSELDRYLGANEDLPICLPGTAVPELTRDLSSTCVQILKVEKRAGGGGSRSTGEGLCHLFVVVSVRSSPLNPEVIKCFYSISVIV